MMRQAHSKGYVFGFKNDLLMNQTKSRDTSMHGVNSWRPDQAEAVNSDRTDKIEVAKFPPKI